MPIASLALDKYILSESGACALAFDPMAWAKPQYSRTKIDLAGEMLLLGVQAGLEFASFMEAVENREDAIEVINNWRAVHSYPLQTIKMTLKRRAKHIDRNAVIAQRLKRLASIKLKLKVSLESGNHPKLSQMQDIGGCRAVMENVSQVRRLQQAFQEASEKNPHRGPQFSKIYDYIATPKASGYRSVHLVYRFRSSSPMHRCYNGQRIEIQLRSRRQHSWATAVETYSTFSGEALKSNIGSDDWKRFFALVSSAIAIEEKSPCVPDTPHTLKGLRPELKNLYVRLNVYNVLSGYTAATKYTKESPDEVMKNADAYLLTLDPEQFSISVTPYKREQLTVANVRYAQLEKEQPKLQVVLVSADSLAGLRIAYPNYFLDTTEFIKIVQRAIGVEPNENKSAV
jgi:ppGpp synthetase/RelA/SpoT-type nucleotidyltranferase